MESIKKSETNVPQEIKVKRKYTKKNYSNIVSNESNNVFFQDETVDNSIENNEKSLDAEDNIVSEIESLSESLIQKSEDNSSQKMVDEFNTERQKALDIISKIKDNIKYDIFSKKSSEDNKEITKKDDSTMQSKDIASTIKKIVDKKEKTQNQVELTPEELEEKIFENFISSKFGELNHFELANTGINLNNFGMLEGRIGKYKLTRPYMGAGWSYTIEK